MRSPSIELALASSGVSNRDVWLAHMEAAEKSDGWLSWCRDRDLYLACTSELVDEIARVLKSCPAPIIDVGAGNGELAVRLRHRGVDVIATDVNPGTPHVLALTARAALAAYQPRTLYSSFLPVDAGIEAEILHTSSVRRYLYIGPQILGRTGPESLWQASGWCATPLPQIDAELISRLDILPDFTRRTHQRGAGSLLFERAL